MSANLTATAHSSSEATLPVAHDWGSRNHVQIFVLMCPMTESFIADEPVCSIAQRLVDLP